MKTFYKLLATALLAVTTNNFVWFALTFWAFLSTKSVIATSTLGGLYLVIMAVSSIWFGSIVDHHRKKDALLVSSAASLILFTAGWIFLRVTPAAAFSSVGSVRLWIFATILLCGTIAGTIYNIAIPTLVGLTVPEDRRDRANGLFGTTIGIAFGITSVASGMVLGFWGMEAALAIAVGASAVAIVAVSMIRVDEPVIAHTADQPRTVDLRGTVRVVRSIPGLFALIFFTTFNNFLGGVFFALMDAYGLSLVSVQAWGTLWGLLSLGIIAGGLFISRRGLGPDPLRTLFRVNFAIWTACIFFTVQPSIVLLAIGTFVWMFSFPFIEAIEQTVLQKVVPPERLGRVIGFAHSIEQSASPITAFFIGPVAQLVFIPFMTTGKGVELIGSWFGVGMGRGIALLFTTAGLVGVVVTALARRSRAYHVLSDRYMQSGSQAATEIEDDQSIVSGSAMAVD
jgi:DHA3 family multidrug efflux protein-like MFS transporter